MEKDNNGNNYFTEKDVPKLRRLYNKALKEEKEEFVYESTELVTDYAKYLLEYFDMMKSGSYANKSK